MATRGETVINELLTKVGLLGAAEATAAAQAYDKVLDGVSVSSNNLTKSELSTEKALTTATKKYSEAAAAAAELARIQGLVDKSRRQVVGTEEQRQTVVAGAASKLNEVLERQADAIRKVAEAENLRRTTADNEPAAKAQEQTAAFERLVHAVDPVAAAEANLAKVNRDLADAEKATIGTAEQHATVRAAAEEKLAAAVRKTQSAELDRIAAQKTAMSAANDMVDAIRGVNTAHTALGPAFARSGQAAEGIGKNFGLASHQVQNLAFQLNDLIVQIGSGQGFLRPMLQQGAQVQQILSMSEGGIGGVLRGVGAALSRIGPLALTAFGSAGALGAVTAASVAMKSYSDEIERMDASVKAFNPRRFDDISAAAKRATAGTAIPARGPVTDVAETLMTKGRAMGVQDVNKTTTALVNLSTQNKATAEDSQKAIAAMDTLLNKEKITTGELVDFAKQFPAFVPVLTKVFNVPAERLQFLDDKMEVSKRRLTAAIDETGSKVQAQSQPWDSWGKSIGEAMLRLDKATGLSGLVTKGINSVTNAVVGQTNAWSQQATAMNDLIPLTTLLSHAFEGLGMIGKASLQGWGNIFSTAGEWISALAAKIPQLGSDIGSFVGGAFTHLGEGVSEAVTTAGGYLDALVAKVRDIASSIGTWFSSAWAAIGTSVSDAVTIASGYIDSWLQKLGASAGTIPNLFQSAWDAVSGFVSSAINKAMGYLDPWVEKVRGIADSISSVFSNAWDAVATTASNVVKTVMSYLDPWIEKIKEVAETIKSYLQAAWDALPAIVQKAVSASSQALDALMGRANQAAKATVNSMQPDPGQTKPPPDYYGKRDAQGFLVDDSNLRNTVTDPIVAAVDRSAEKISQSAAMSGRTQGPGGGPSSSGGSGFFASGGAGPAGEGDYSSLYAGTDANRKYPRELVGGRAAPLTAAESADRYNMGMRELIGGVASASTQATAAARTAHDDAGGIQRAVNDNGQRIVNGLGQVLKAPFEMNDVMAAVWDAQDRATGWGTGNRKQAGSFGFNPASRTGGGPFSGSLITGRATSRAAQEMEQIRLGQLIGGGTNEELLASGGGSGTMAATKALDELADAGTKAAESLDLGDLGAPIKSQIDTLRGLQETALSRTYRPDPYAEKNPDFFYSGERIFKEGQDKVYDGLQTQIVKLEGLQASLATLVNQNEAFPSAIVNAMIAAGFGDIAQQIATAFRSAPGAPASATPAPTAVQTPSFTPPGMPVTPTATQSTGLSFNSLWK